MAASSSARPAMIENSAAVVALVLGNANLQVVEGLEFGDRKQRVGRRHRGLHLRG
jgi:hypothetical protein